MRRFAVITLLIISTCTWAQVTYEPAGIYQMEETHTVQGNLQAAAIFARIPSDSDTQQITNLQIDPAEVMLLEDATGHEKCAVVIAGQPTESLEVSLRYTVSCQTKILDKEILATIDYPDYDFTDEEIAPFLKAQDRVESTSPKIAKLADDFKENFPNPYQRVYAIYTWVIEHLTYEEIPGKGALWALERKRGRCTEYATLFVAICRAAGIPARECSGILPDHEDHFHSWAEFNLPEVGWVPCDPQMGDGEQQVRDFCFAALPDARILQFQYRDFPVIVDFDSQTARLAEENEQGIQLSQNVCVMRGQGQYIAHATPRRQTSLRHAILLTHSDAPRVLETNLDENMLQDFDAKHQVDGAGCVSLSIANASDELRWAAIWEPVSGVQRILYPELSQNELSDILQDAMSQGLMPVSLSSCVLKSQPVYAVVLGEAQGVQWRYLIGHPADKFANQVTSAQQSGQILTSLATHRQKDTLYASGIFMTLPQRVSQGFGLWLTEDEMYDKLDQFDQYPIAPLTIAATADFPSFFSMSAMDLGTNYNWDLRVELSEDELKTVLDDAAMQGLYPSRVVIY